MHTDRTGFLFSVLVIPHLVPKLFPVSDTWHVLVCFFVSFSEGYYILQSTFFSGIELSKFIDYSYNTFFVCIVM